MDQKTLILIYYVIKRLFIFFDEWMFYYILIKLYDKKYKKITLMVLVYGLCCIYTSYKNIDKVEKDISDADQIVFLTDTLSFYSIQDKIYKLIEYCRPKLIMV